MRRMPHDEQADRDEVATSGVHGVEVAKRRDGAAQSEQAHAEQRVSASAHQLSGLSDLRELVSCDHST